MSKLARLAAAVWVVSTPLLARADAPTPVPTPKPCSTPEYRQFDFWAGSWNVTMGGKAAGTNTIQPIEAGCALQETWRGAGGGSGTSLNAWDARRQVWHQTWTGADGGVLLLDGVFKDGKMVLTGQHPAVKDPKATVLERITWSPLPSGQVRQLWESSLDGGKTWTVAFDGLYTRK